MNYRQYSIKQNLVQIQNKRHQSNVICVDFNQKYHFFVFSVHLKRLQSCDPFKPLCWITSAHTVIFSSSKEDLQYHLLTVIQCLLKDLG